MHAADSDNTHHAKPTPGGLHTGAIAAVGVIGLIILAVIVIAAEAWFYRLEDQQFAQNEYTQPNAAVTEYRKQKAEELSTTHYRVVEDQATKKQTQFLVVPVNAAMKLLADNGLKSAPATSK